MQGWSWMAALTLVVASTGAFAPSSTVAAEPTPTKQKVKLVLRLDGVVVRAGTEITVKPGNPGCRFKVVTKPVKEEDFVELIDVETVNADRDCSFAITVKEPGQPRQDHPTEHPGRADRQRQGPRHPDLLLPPDLEVGHRRTPGRDRQGGRAHPEEVSPGRSPGQSKTPGNRTRPSARSRPARSSAGPFRRPAGQSTLPNPGRDLHPKSERDRRLGPSARSRPGVRLAFSLT